MIKAILLDIDGTLTNSKKEITPETKKALLKAQEAGVRLVLSSGRPERGLYKLAEELDMFNHGGLFICFNGSRVLNCQTGEVLFNQPMSIEEGKAVLENIKKFKVGAICTKDEYMVVEDVFNHDINLGDEEHPEMFNIMKYESRMNNYILREVRDLVEFCDFEMNKILTYGDPAYLKAHAEEMAEPFKDTLNCMFTAKWYFEYTAKGVDKAKAIDSSLPKLGIKKDEMMAFGDAQNDISMIKYVGLGIAMGNATEETKAAADYITLDNEHDGIAKALYKFMPEVF